MAVVLIKPGAQPKLLNLMAAVGNVAATLTAPAEVWVTSGMDGIHSSDHSAHYALRALDLRTKNFPSEAAKLDFLAKLKAYLGADYFCLYEALGTPNEHLHIEYRPQ